MKRYHRPFPNTWWLARRPYFLFMVREISSLFIAIFCLGLLCVVYQLSKGAEAYNSLLQALKSPGWIALHVVILLFALYNSCTAFNLAPRVLVVWRGEERVPPVLIAGAHYAGWIAVSAVLTFILVKGF